MQMDMEEDKINITLNIAGKKFSLRVDRTNEETYRKAAKMIEERMNIYRSRFGESIADRLTEMAALDLALKIVKNENLNDESPVFGRLETLDQEVQDLLKE